MDSDEARCHSADKAITCEEAACTVQTEGNRGNEDCAKTARTFLGLHLKTILETKKTSQEHQSEI